jgi:tryptophanase
MVVPVTDSILLVQRILTKEALEGFENFKIGQVIRTMKYGDKLVLSAKKETVL